MTSRFETFFKSHALPVLQREFNRTIDLIGTDDCELKVQCFVELDEVSTGEGFSDLQGRISIASETYNKYMGTQSGQWTRARIRGYVWDVYASDTDQYGTVIMSVRRKHENQKNTNIYDLDGTQAVWADEE